MSDEHDRHLETDVASGTEAEEGFVNRWSRRKREAREADGWAEQPASPDSTPQAVAERAESQAAELTDADMPALESLDEHSDYRGFLSPKVSEALRRAALRKLFGMSRFNVCDGLDDYAQDFTTFEPLGDLVTHDMRRLLARERERLAEALEQGEGSDRAPRLAASDEVSGSPELDPPLESVDGDPENRATPALPGGSEK